VDGSAESDQAVWDVGELFGPLWSRVVLVAVVPADAEVSGRSERAAALELLIDRAGWLASGGEPPLLQVGMGQPAWVLLTIAHDPPSPSRSAPVMHRPRRNVAASATSSGGEALGRGHPHL
jgi:hypothetical protein